jgi:hypothetical protein
MKQELQDNLLEYLGELMYDLDNNKDYFKRLAIENKINAINTLIDMQKREIKTLYDLYKKSWERPIKLKSQYGVSPSDELLIIKCRTL